MTVGRVANDLGGSGSVDELGGALEHIEEKLL